MQNSCIHIAKFLAVICFYHSASSKTCKNLDFLRRISYCLSDLPSWVQFNFVKRGVQEVPYGSVLKCCQFSLNFLNLKALQVLVCLRPQVCCPYIRTVTEQSESFVCFITVWVVTLMTFYQTGKQSLHVQTSVFVWLPRRVFENAEISRTIFNFSVSE